MKEQINHPEYYISSGIEAADFIDAHDLNFNLGNVIKYIVRAGKKNGEDMLTALKKAQWYLDREIVHVESKQTEVEQLKAHQAEIMKTMRPAIYDPEHYPEDREL